jgi:hypothetical protein
MNSMKFVGTKKARGTGAARRWGMVALVALMASALVFPSAALAESPTYGGGYGRNSALFA